MDGGRTPRAFRCWHCGKGLSSRRNLARHLQAAHKPEGLAWHCRRCAFSTSRKDNFRRHYRVVHPNQQVDLKFIVREPRDPQSRERARASVCRITKELCEGLPTAAQGSSSRGQTVQVGEAAPAGQIQETAVLSPGDATNLASSPVRRGGKPPYLQYARSQPILEDTLSIHGGEIDEDTENSGDGDDTAPPAAATASTKDTNTLELWSLDKALMGTVTKVTEERVILSYNDGTITHEERISRTYDVVFHAEFADGTVKPV